MAAKKKSAESNRKTVRKSTQQKEIIEILQEHPQIRVAAVKVGVHFSTIYRWIQDEHDFQQKVADAIDTGEASRNDAVELKLMEGIHAGDMVSTRYYLDRRHPKYQGTPSKNIFTNALTEERMKLIAEAVKSWRKWMRRKIKKNQEK